MAEGTFISFGANPDADAGGSMMAGPTTHQDGIAVSEEIGDVAHSLATGGDGGWPRFERSWADDSYEVYVNPANVRFITTIAIRD
jgi:hypothetical protein